MHNIYNHFLKNSCFTYFMFFDDISNSNVNKNCDFAYFNSSTHTKVACIVLDQNIVDSIHSLILNPNPL